MNALCDPFFARKMSKIKCLLIKGKCKHKICQLIFLLRVGTRVPERDEVGDAAGVRTSAGVGPQSFVKATARYNIISLWLTPDNFTRQG